MPKTGDRVRARPAGADEVIPDENILDWDPYDGPTEDLVGTLEIRRVGGGGLVPEYDQYLVDGRLADPATVEPVATEAMRARSATLSVIVGGLAKPMADKGAQRHDPRTGRYVSKGGSGTGGSGGSAGKSAGSAGKTAARKVPKKTGSTALTAEDKRQKQLAQLAEARRAAAEKRAAGTLKPREPKAKNPKVLTDDPTTYTRNWTERVPKETGWDHPVPVKEFSVLPGSTMRMPDGSWHASPAYVVHDGWAFRVNGKAYLVESSPHIIDNKAAAARRGKEMAAQFEGTVPKHLHKYQDGFAFLEGRNPADPAWAVRYRRPDFRSVAVAGDGTTTVFGGRMISRASMVHELGHNIDYGEGRGYGQHLSDKPTWTTAQKSDARLGDAVDRRANLYPSTPPGWQSHDIRLGDPAGVSSYGRAAKAEDFAESVRLFLTDKAGIPIATHRDTGQSMTFKDLFPARAKLIARYLKMEP